ncbi:TetR/AcrR family transcriptional regulator [Bacillus sp. A015]
MSREKIKEVAVKHYIQFGYEGTKLSQIAEEVGIRKQSLSYHFKSNRSLFNEVCKETIETEVQFIQQYFRENAHKPVEQQLYQYLNEYKVRYRANSNTRFLIEIAFLVSDEILADINKELQIYMDCLTETLETCFSKQTFRKSEKECALAFLIVLDGLETQLVYEDSARYDQVQNIIWDIFWTGIQE